MLFAFGDESITLRHGDELAVAAVLTDQYGREFLAVENALVLSEAANELVWEVSAAAPPYDPAGFTY